MLIALDSARFTPTGVGTIRQGTVPSARKSVHPHGRGDNRRIPRPPRVRDGSPPRAWGQLAALWRGGGQWRFTPTGVGTMPTPTLSPSPSPVHPHGRGDNRCRRRAACCVRGSPPRTWGQCCLLRSLSLRRWFTPTGVGTMRRWCSGRPSATVHPHGRGDNDDAQDVCCIIDGSPPRAWGQ